MAEPMVYTRAAKIAKAITKLKPSPDIILFQEVFPRDYFLLSQSPSYGFRWPKSKDWPPKDMKTIIELLNEDHHYHPALIERKQQASTNRYQTISQSLTKMIINGQSYAETLEHPYLNKGPSGTAILVKKSIQRTNLKSGKIQKVPLNLKGHFFRPYKSGNVLNKLVPLSRGALKAFVEIKNLGFIDIATSHLTTGEPQNKQRAAQVEEFLTDHKLLQRNPELLANQFLEEDKNIFCDHKLSAKCLNQFTHRSSNPSQKSFNAYLDYLKNIKSKNHILSLYGGDFNFEPYGRRNSFTLKRKWDKTAYLNFLTKSRFQSAVDAYEKFKETNTYHSEENHYARDNKTSAGQVLGDKINDFSANLPSHLQTQLSSLTKPLLKKLNASNGLEIKKLDYIMYESHHSQVFTSVKKTELIFKDNPISDHYGLMTDFLIYHKAD